MPFPRQQNISWRILDCIPVTISLSIILLPILFSVSAPRTVAVFMVFYSFLWFLFSLEYSFFLLISFYKYRRADHINWRQKVRDVQSTQNLSKRDFLLKGELQKQDDWIPPEEVRHLVIIATCGEPLDILRETFTSLAESDIDRENIYVCLATEEHKKESGRENAKLLEKEFLNIFGRFFWVEHPANLPNEIRGKGANITHAARRVTAQLEKDGEKLESIIVTTLDADNKPDPQYFSALTYHFCLQEKRQKKSYQPLPLFYNNIWDVPLINRMMAISSGFWHMIESGRPDRLRNFASHAQPLSALKEMDFWALDTIVEDGHQFWRSYLHFQGDYSVVPIFIPIYQDAVLNQNYYRSLVGQYKQIRRWAWGCSDISFCGYYFWKLRCKLPTWQTIVHFCRLLQSHIMWATAAIFITLSAPVSRMINVHFQETTVANNMGFLLSIFFRIAIIGIFVSIALSLNTLPKAPSTRKRLSLIWQWLFLPIMTIVMGSFPALEAQLRLAIKKPLEFNVTEKVRLARK